MAEVVVAVAPAAARVALVAGATGLVGREVLAALLADKGTGQVHVVVRRPIGVRHAKLIEHRLADFTALPVFPALDDVYIALGTTIKVAGSQEAFRAVDYDAVVAVARAARAAGATRLGVVSAMGADARSKVFYNRVKGEMEQAVAQLGFASTVIARPSLIDGDRAALAQVARTAEGLGLRLMRVLRPLIPANYRAIQASHIARGLLRAVAQGLGGVRVLLSGELQPH
jgi:uncharacterized protein YbjT (DUF2867 family)